MDAMSTCTDLRWSKSAKMSYSAEACANKGGKYTKPETKTRDIRITINIKLGISS